MALETSLHLVHFLLLAQTVLNMRTQRQEPDKTEIFACCNILALNQIWPGHARPYGDFEAGGENLAFGLGFESQYMSVSGSAKNKCK